MTDGRIVSQKWEDVQNISVNSICHVCLSKEKVKVGKIRINRRDTGEFTGYITKWKLCGDCDAKGWEPSEATPMTVFNTSAAIMYKNENGKTKSAQVWFADISTEKELINSEQKKRINILN